MNCDLKCMVPYKTRLRLKIHLSAKQTTITWAETVWKAIIQTIYISVYLFFGQLKINRSDRSFETI